MAVRMNWGCGSVQPELWVNVDKDFRGDVLWWDKSNAGAPIDGPWKLDVRREFPRHWSDSFDYIVANHSLSDLTFHELPGALSELYRVLKPGGVLRVLVPHFEEAIRAWERHDRDWFPQGSDLETVDERFCTFVVWFGTVGSVFTPHYLYDLLHETGFEKVGAVARDHTIWGLPEIVSLDGDRTTALIFEGRK